MAGNERDAKVISFLERLTGDTIDGGRVKRLRSVQRAALTAWARREGIPLRSEIVSLNAFTVDELLAEGGATDTTVDYAEPSAAPAIAIQAGRTGTFVGVDIEDVASLPEVDDYREHHFYVHNFTVSEIAHCIRQTDARASFAGLWAAKEAVVKSGFFDARAISPAKIEIRHDDEGRPLFPGANLSISHTPTTAVAICIADRQPVKGETAPVVHVESNSAGVADCLRAIDGPRRGGPSALAVAVLVALIAVGCAIALGLHFASAI